ncbi:gala protein [Halostreptopolyspora alba]|uniref:Gala protein n=1 Tax=Halostreptopolyspora alba TaxID=2487137 RepID=A0A3N0E9X5_9ACTN|nr:gala protein [Nocardiopsaceae bacterium YIM 96095]
MTERQSVQCPVISAPDVTPADPAQLRPLLDRLADPASVRSTEGFARGTLRPDGRVDLCKQGLGPEGARLLLPSVPASAHARHLLLGTNAIADSGARALAATLATRHHVTTLYLGCNRITAEGAEALATALEADRTVRALWLKRNPIGDEGVTALATALRHNTTIRTLDLVNTGVTRHGLAVLLDALSGRPEPVERLHLGGNGLGADSADILAGLVTDGGVRELHLAANHLGDDGAARIAAAAAPARTVGLGLGGNGVGVRGAAALAGALGGVHSLDLSRPPSQRALGAPDNVTGDEGASALAEALPDSPIRRLALQRTGITGRGALRILREVRPDSHLEYVGLGAGVPRRVKRELRRRLRPATAPPADVRAIGSVYR